MPAEIRKFNRFVAYLFFVGLAFVVSLFMGNRKSGDGTDTVSLIPPAVPTAQADISGDIPLDTESGSCGACGGATGDSASGDGGGGGGGADGGCSGSAE